MVPQKILLVEDQAIIALAQAQILVRNGFEVITVHTGEDAVRAAIDHPEVDIILMDIDLGSGMDGTEAARQILERCDTPILFLSSHTEPEVVEKTEKITSYGYVVKNSGETVLLASIRMAFKLYTANLKFRIAVDFTADWAYWIDGDGEFVYMSPSCENLTGYTREEFIRDPGLMTEIIHPDDLPAVQECFSTSFRPEGVQTIDYRIVTRSGEERWIGHRSQSIYTDGGLWRGKRGSGRDITAQKRAEAEILASKEKYRKLSFLTKGILESPDGIIIFALDKEYRYLDFTLSHKRTMKKIWGVEIKNGVNMLDCIAIDLDRQTAKKNFDRALAGERFLVTEEYGNEDLTRSYYDDRYSPVFDETGNVIGVSVFVVERRECNASPTVARP